MERQQSTIYSRLQQRATVRDARRAEADVEDMRWGAGALLAIKDPDTRFIVVRVASSVDGATADSGTKFKAFMMGYNAAKSTKSLDESFFDGIARFEEEASQLAFEVNAAKATQAAVNKMGMR